MSSSIYAALTVGYTISDNRGEVAARKARAEFLEFLKSDFFECSESLCVVPLHRRKEIEHKISLLFRKDDYVLLVEGDWKSRGTPLAKGNASPFLGVLGIRPGSKGMLGLD